MNAFMIGSLFALLSAWQSPSAAATPDAAPAHPAEAASSIEIRRSTATRIVYKEITGAYWRIGPSLVEFSEYMTRHDLRGPVFVKYFEDPARLSASMRMHVGCATDGAHHAQPPWLTAEEVPATVAVLKLAESSNPSVASFRGLDSWLKQEGLAAAGPVTEWFEVVTTEKSGPKAFRPLELQIRINPRPTGASEPIAASQVPRPIESDVMTVVDSDSPSKDVSAGRSEEPESKHFPAASIHELVQQNNYDEIARTVIPDAGRLDSDWTQWLGLVVSRFAAARRGIETLYPGSGLSIWKLVDPMETRFRKNFAAAGVGSSTSSAYSLLPTDSASVLERKKVIRMLDHLLGRIAVRALDEPSCFKELVDLLEKVQKLIQTNSNR